MKTNTIVVEVSGGVVQAVWNLPQGQDWMLLDWDNLLPDSGDVGDTEKEWNKFDPEAQAWIQANYSDDYKTIMERIAADRKPSINCPDCGNHPCTCINRVGDEAESQASKHADAGYMNDMRFGEGDGPDY